ncbi:MAG: hypothetical protein IT342_01770 [Candidatus Melainabacteria bacterium]|nr:hypothetical protein [Candidatus Melainabacteria bacterium]
MKTVEIGRMFLDDASKEGFIGFMQKSRPRVKLILTDVNTCDLASAMPDFLWAGNGAISHIDLNLAKFITLPHRDQ